MAAAAAVDNGFLRSPRGAVKIARAVGPEGSGPGRAGLPPLPRGRPRRGTNPPHPRCRCPFLSPQVVAFVTFLCFVASRSGGAYTALALMETVITALFFLLYLLKLDKKLRWLFWPLAVSRGRPSRGSGATPSGSDPHPTPEGLPATPRSPLPWS